MRRDIGDHVLCYVAFICVISRGFTPLLFALERLLSTDVCVCAVTLAYS